MSTTDTTDLEVTMNRKPNRKPTGTYALIPLGQILTSVAAQAEPEPIVVDEAGDPRGDAACPECDEGELESTGARHPAATLVRCNVCGYSA